MTETAMTTVPLPDLALTEAQVATAFGCHRATVRRLIRRGDLRSFKVGRCRRVWASEIQRFTAATGGETEGQASARRSSQS